MRSQLAGSQGRHGGDRQSEDDGDRHDRERHREQQRYECQLGCVREAHRGVEAHERRQHQDEQAHDRRHDREGVRGRKRPDAGHRGHERRGDEQAHQELALAHARSLALECVCQELLLLEARLKRHVGRGIDPSGLEP